MSPDVQLSITPSRHPLSSGETPTNTPLSHDSPTGGPPFSPIDPAGCSQERQTQEQEVIHLVPRPLATVKLCGDNIDWTVHPSHVRCDQQTQSIHYFHSYAVKDRIDLSSLSDNPPTDQPTSTEVISKIFPSAHEDSVICDDFAILLARMLCSNMKFFKDTFTDSIDWHIQHRYSVEMSKKSEVVSNVIT